jgi:hypothetical protein
MQAVFTGGDEQMGDGFVVVKTGRRRRSKIPNVSTIKMYGRYEPAVAIEKELE